MPGVVVITGAGGGIGRAIALGLARDGWAVGLLDVNGASAAEAAAEVSAAGGRAVSRAAGRPNSRTAAAIAASASAPAGCAAGRLSSARMRHLV